MLKKRIKIIKLDRININKYSYSLEVWSYFYLLFISGVREAGTGWGSAGDKSSVWCQMRDEEHTARCSV